MSAHSTFYSQNLSLCPSRIPRGQWVHRMGEKLLDEELRLQGWPVGARKRE